eukprot:scaffold143838_cov22-Tisochrysis_lutea.AAC.1
MHPLHSLYNCSQVALPVPAPFNQTSGMVHHVCLVLSSSAFEWACTNMFPSYSDDYIIRKLMLTKNPTFAGFDARAIEGLG